MCGASGDAAIHGVGWVPSCAAVSSWLMTSLAHLLDGWLLAGTIKDLLAEHVLCILQWAHPHTGIRIPKSIRKGQASLCNHFSSFCLQCKRNHMAKPNFKEGEIKSTSWQEELQSDIAAGCGYKERKRWSYFCSQLTKDSLTFPSGPL